MFAYSPTCELSRFFGSLSRPLISLVGDPMSVNSNYMLLSKLVFQGTFLVRTSGP